MSILELVEHARAVPRPLDMATGRALAASGIVKAAPDPHLPGHWLVKAGSKVGAVTVTVPGHQPLTLRIAPKLPIARIFFLLGYSLDCKGWRDGAVNASAWSELLPAVAHAFERLVKDALRQGLLQGYRPAEGRSMVVRGRICESEQMRRHYGNMLPMEIRFDEFTTDIAENRLLRAAIECLLRLPGVDLGIRRRLMNHRTRLVDVSTLGRGRELPTWFPSRLNSRYQSALRLAELILRTSSVEHVAGDVRIDGFLFDMNKLFEDFVTVALQEALLGSGGHCRLQARHHLDDAGALRIRPDFVYYDPDGMPRAVADAKYKAGKPSGYPDADIYQMLAYCTALGLPEGHLVYAKGSVPRASHRLRHTDVTIHQHALDLEQKPTDLLAEITALARRLMSAPTAGHV